MMVHMDDCIWQLPPFFDRGKLPSKLSTDRFPYVRSLLKDYQNCVFVSKKHILPSSHIPHCCGMSCLDDARFGWGVVPTIISMEAEVKRTEEEGWLWQGKEETCNIIKKEEQTRQCECVSQTHSCSEGGFGFQGDCGGFVPSNEVAVVQGSGPVAGKASKRGREAFYE